MDSWSLLLSQYVSGMAMFFNLFMVFIVIQHSHQHIGRYKWALAAYASLNVLLCLVIFLSVPVEILLDTSIVVFSSGGLLIGKILGPVLFLALYHLWFAMIVILFAWRYIVLCKQYWAVRIRHSVKVKVSLVTLFCFLGTAYILTSLLLSGSLKDSTRTTLLNLCPYYFEQNGTNFIVFRLDHWSGMIAMGEYTVIVVVFLIASIIYGKRISMRIRDLKRGFSSSDAKINKQIYMALILQTVNPLVVVSVPQLMLSALSATLNVAQYIPVVYPLLFSLSRFLDPVIWLLTVQEYKQSIFLPISNNCYCSTREDDTEIVHTGRQCRRVATPSQ